MLPVSVYAAEAENQENYSVSEFDMQNYLNSYPVDTAEEFVGIIETYGDEKSVENIEDFKAEIENYCNDEYNQNFTYHYDTENQLIITSAIYEKIDDSKMRAKSGSKNFISINSVFSKAGSHIYTVTGEATFYYNNDVSCSVSSAVGYFNPASMSAWTGSVSVDKGNKNAKSAYVSVYGTANLNLAIAEILGLTVNIQSANFLLTLTCDSQGNTASTFSNSAV